MKYTCYYRDHRVICRTSKSSTRRVPKCFRPFRQSRAYLLKMSSFRFVFLSFYFRSKSPLECTRGSDGESSPRDARPMVFTVMRLKRRRSLTILYVGDILPRNLLLGETQLSNSIRSAIPRGRARGAGEGKSCLYTNDWPTTRERPTHVQRDVRERNVWRLFIFSCSMKNSKLKKRVNGGWSGPRLFSTGDKRRYGVVVGCGPVGNGV